MTTETDDDDLDPAGDVALQGDADEDQWAPVHWPSMSAEDAEVEWPSLFAWVEKWRVRYPNGVRLPECWHHHNDLVEALAALRDHERACFAPKAPGTSAVEWQRAMRDIEMRLETWIKRLTCSVPGRGHPSPAAPRSTPSDWDVFVRADLLRRAVDG